MKMTSYKLHFIVHFRLLSTFNFTFKKLTLKFENKLHAVVKNETQTESQSSSDLHTIFNLPQLYQDFTAAAKTLTLLLQIHLVIKMKCIKLLFNK